MLNSFIEGVFSNIKNINNEDIKKFNINVPSLIKIKYYNKKFTLYSKSNEIDSRRAQRIDAIINYFNNLKIDINYKYEIILIVNVGDGNLYNFNIPIFSFNKKKYTNNILLYNIYFLHEKKIFNKLNNLEKKDINLDKKIKKVIFVGMNSNKDRNKLMNLYKNNNSFFIKLLNRTTNNNENRVSIEEQLKYKYNITIDGFGTSFDRFPWQLLSNSLVLKIKSNNDLIEWFYPFIQDCYIECTNDELLDVKEYFDNNTNVINNINKKSQKFVKSYLNKKFMDIYTTQLLKYYFNLYINSFKEIKNNFLIKFGCNSIKYNNIGKKKNSIYFVNITTKYDNSISNLSLTKYNVIYNKTNYPIYGQQNLFRIIKNNCKIYYNLEFAGQCKIILDNSSNISIIIQAEHNKGVDDMMILRSLNQNKKIIYIGNMFNEQIPNYETINYKHIWLPYAGLVFTEMYTYKPENIFNLKYNDYNDRKLLCYMSSRQVHVRKIIWDKICNFCINNKLGDLDSYGRCNGYKKLANVFEYPCMNSEFKNNTRFDNTVELYKKYKFIFVSENCYNNHGYITEKIVLAFSAGAIPIYYGCEQIFEIFNKGSFLYINKSMDNIDDVLDKVKLLSSDINLFIKFKLRPIIEKKKFDKFFKYKDLIDYINNMNYQIM